MPNLFSGLRKATNETIAMQVALLESVTVTNLTKPYAQKTGATAVKAVKWLANKFNKEIDVVEPEVKEIKDLINEHYCIVVRNRCLRRKTKNFWGAV